MYIQSALDLRMNFMCIMLAHYYRMDVDTIMSRLVFDKCIRDTTSTTLRCFV